jgi:hypothetical protein
VFGRRRAGERLAAAGMVLACALMSVGLVSTAVRAVQPLTPVALGTAETFSVLSGASVANTATGTPITTLRGDLGVTIVNTISGFPPGVVTGTKHNADSTAIQAHADVFTAYNDAASRTPDLAFAGDQIGVTLSPGVYNSGAAVGNTGILTLDAGDDANAVFIFQVTGAVSMAAASEVKLINGAQASRVFWQVSGAVTLGANARFAGTIMAIGAISIGAGAILNGRAFARTGAITLDTNLIYTTPPVVTITGGATATTTTATPTITGTTDVAPGRTVTVTVGPQTLTTTVLTGGTWSVTAEPLANATHQVIATVTDTQGNNGSATQSLTVSVDTTPPVVTITGGTTATTTSATPTITGTTDEAAGANVTVTVDGQTLTTTVQSNSTWSVSAALIGNGTYPVVASVTDAHSNTGSATQSLTVDTVLPIVTITGGAAVATNDATPTISGTTDTATGTTVTVTIAGQTLTALVQSNATWNVTPTTVADGTHTVTASVADPAGNPGSATQALTVDTVAPVVTITGGATALTNDPTPTIQGTTTSDVAVGSTLTATIAGQTLTATVQSGGTWSVTAATVADGPHSVVVTATDIAGNPGSKIQTLTVDTAAPTVTIVGGTTRLTNDSTPTIAGTTDAAAATTVTVTVAGQTLTALVQSGGTWNVTPATTVADGPYTIVTSITDPAGNPGSASQTLTIDTTAPAVTITGGATALANDPTPTISGATDAAATTLVTVTVAGQTLTTTVQSGGTWVVTATTLLDGPHPIVATIADPAGNPGSATQTLTIDTTSPVVAITGGATAFTNDPTPTISGTTDAATGTPMTVTIAGQTLAATVQAGGTWTVTAATLTDGPYDVTASITDPVGNPGSASQALTVDTVSPTVAITGGAAMATNDPTPTITGTTNAAPGRTVTVTVGVQTLTTLVQTGGTWTVTATALTDATRTVTASVTDAAGNPGSATQALTVDTVAPTATITGGATALTSDPTPTIAGTTTPDVPVGMTVTVSVAAQTLTTVVQTGGTWTVVAGPLTDGPHTVSVATTDAAGNSGGATQVLTIDTTAPAMTITGGPNRLTNDATPTISGTTDAAPATTVTVAVGGQTLTALVQIGGTWNVTPATVADGTSQAVAWVTDAAGNTASATQSITIDTVAPIVAIAGGSAALTTDATPTIAGTTDAVMATAVTVTTSGQTLSTTVQAGGGWNSTTAPLTDGVHNVAVSVTDLAGNTGHATQALRVDTVTPAAAVLDFSPVGPKRIFDTRPGQSPNALRTVAKQKVSGVNELQVQVTDLPGFVPASGVGAVSLNVTATNSDGDGFITVYPCGNRESVSSVNYSAGETVANAVIAPVSATGTVCFFSSAPTDIVADINGWFAAGQAFTAAGPKRVFDTRPGQSPQALRSVSKAKIQAGTSIEVQFTDLAGLVPANGVSSVSLNVTATNPGASGFVTVYSCGARELVSSLNFVAGQTVANAVIAQVSPSGTVCFYSSATTDLVVDINGWMKAGSSFTATSATRVLDTRAGESPNAIRNVAKGKIGGAYVLEVKVTDLPGLVPATGVGAVSLNLTATNPEGSGFITVYSCGTRELVSNLNFSSNQTKANAVLSPVSTTGTICIYSLTPADVIIDINGWFSNTMSAG